MENKKSDIQELNQIREKYNRLIENIEDAIVRYEIGKGITFANPAVEKITGYTVEQFYSDKEFPIKIVHDDFRERLKKVFNDILERKLKNETFVMKWVRKDGKVIWIRHKIILILDAQENIEAIEIIGRDITSRQEQLIERMNSSIDGMALFDSDWNFIYLNPKFAELYGYDLPEELIGKSWSILYSQDELKNINENIIPELIDKDYWVGKNEGKRKDGILFPQTISLRVLKNQMGEITGFTCIIINIKERERLEAQRRQAQKLETVGQLAGGIAHNFNNMLSGIMGYTQLMLHKEKQGSIEYKNLNKILNISQRASEMVKQLLDFSRISWSNPGPVDLNLLVQSTANLLSDSIPESIEIEIVLQDNLWSIKADMGQIKSILVNLAMNAKEAMSNGGKLTIETRNVVISGDENSTERRFVMISVTDNGIGINEDIQDKIFEPFFSTKEMGTGLGLSQVYGIVRQHRGWIDFETEPGRGTKFSIFLPALET